MHHHKFKVAIVFSIAAIFPYPLVLLSLSGDILGTINFIYRHTEAIIPYFVLPLFTAFISAYLFGDKIKYDNKIKYKNLVKSALTSILIVVLSLLLWAVAITFVAQNHERWYGFEMAPYAATTVGWLVYTPGLLAGYVVWRSTKT